ncbi:DUF1150 family protein [Kiloniella sp. b19]|uniref:DUF1150 family protein n=1 Tax=Kiloniella sp. GXU_MW_B19 TaxID=3141326 RepID=UPI0031E1B5EF
MNAHKFFEHSALSEQDMMQLGVEAVAYVRPVEEDGEELYGIFAADGTQIASVENRDIAFATILQNDLSPLSVH